MRHSIAGRIASLTILAFLAARSAQAAWLDDFSGATFDPRWGEDEPNPALGTVSLDTVNDLAHFEAFGNTDMWVTRNNAPILWTDTPAGNFTIETRVTIPVGQNVTVSGLTVYGDGVGSDDGEHPNFTFGLDHWSSPLVKLQGLGTNNPNIAQPVPGGEAWLQLELQRDGGAGGLDRYVARYKLNEADPWSPLAVLDRDVANARVGLFQKTGGGGRTSDFSYVAVDEPVPPPTPTSLWSVDMQTVGDNVMSGVETVYGYGNVWNAFEVAHHPGTTTDPTMMLMDSDGNPTPVTFSIVGTVSGWDNGGPLRADYMFFDAGNVPDTDSILWSLTGLTPGDMYELYVYGGNVANRSFNMTVDVDGNGTLVGDTAQLIDTIGYLFPSIVASADGSIIGNAVSLGREANWSGFQLAQFAPEFVIPEPCTFALLGAGLLPVLRRRRR